MTEEVLVRVSGVQTTDGETQKAPELITTGTYSRDALAHRLIYTEVLGDDGACTENELLFTENKAELKKDGEVQAHLIFEEGTRNLTRYQTPYGEINMEMETHTVDVHIAPEHMCVRLAYDVTMNGAALSEFDLTVQIDAKR